MPKDKTIRRDYRPWMVIWLAASLAWIVAGIRLGMSEPGGINWTGHTNSVFAVVNLTLAFSSALVAIMLSVMTDIVYRRVEPTDLEKADTKYRTLVTCREHGEVYDKTVWMKCGIDDIILLESRNLFGVIVGHEFELKKAVDK